jgi:SAM-dependent methyltransferase
MSGALGTDPYQEEVLSKLAENASRYNEWVFERAAGLIGGRVLDVGAGLGTFTELAARRAQQVLALEPDAKLSELLTERFGSTSNVRVVAGDLADLTPQLIGSPVDSVLCLNVLEHVRDDADALARIRDVLAPHGKLLLLVPAHPRLFGSLDRSAKHERRYRKQGLKQLLEASGFDVRAIQHVNPLGILGWFVWGKILGAPGLPVRPLGAYDRLVPVLRVLDRVRFPVGLSLWAVAERRL